MSKKLVYSLIVLSIILAIVGLWYLQRNVFSKDTLKLEIIGPDTVEVGQSIDYTIKYKNNGDIVLTGAKLTFAYPENSLVEDRKLRAEKPLEDIYPGEEKTINFSARIFGKENELKTAKAWLQFQPRNLKASYEVSTTQTAVIKFSPLTFELDLLSRLEPEKDFSFSVNYFSNIDYPLSQLRAKIEYPTGFEFTDSTPKALGTNEWQLPLLNKAQGGRITVSGRLKGDVGEQKVFKATLGLWQEDGAFVLLKEATKGTEIVKPNIYLSQMINGRTDYSANPGDTLHYEIFFKNIGTSPFENLFLVLNLEGSLFDFDSLKAPGADFHPGDSSAIWDWKTTPQLRFLDENDEGKVEFWINLRKELSPTEPKSTNLVLKDTITLSPAREEFTVKINSQLVLDQAASFNDEVFGNSGPLPLQVSQPTTFTVVWKLKNFYNDLKNVKVKATLSLWASLTGKLFPREAKFVFDSQSREIIWEVGDLLAGQGVNNEAPNLSFQVSLLPQPSQRGQAIDIVSQAQATGDDTWAQETIQTDSKSVNTSSLSDTNFNPGQGVVQ
jgi:hypothetical protein